MTRASLRLEWATENDIPFIMATERLPGYEALVGRSDEDRHRQALSDERHAYFIARDQHGPIGFAILRDWNSADHVTLIKRVAVTHPGRGHGRAMLRALVNAAFEGTAAYRLWIGLFPQNTRARRAYEAAGFVAEGIARGNVFFDGENRDELIMSILRPEWAARHHRTAFGSHFDACGHDASGT